MPANPTTARLAASLALVLAAAPLQGCLTQSLWEESQTEADDDAALTTPARVALTPVALAGDAAICAVLAVAYVGPYAAACCCRCR